MKRAAADMARRGSGRILNVASVAGFMPGPWMAVYHATKAYMLSLSEAVGAEVAGTGVTITALCPGATRTQFFAGEMAEGRNLLTRMPMKSAADVATAGWTAMEKGQRIVIPGLGPKVSAMFPRVVPRRLTTWITGLMEKPRR